MTAPNNGMRLTPLRGATDAARWADDPGGQRAIP